MSKRLTILLLLSVLLLGVLPTVSAQVDEDCPYAEWYETVDPDSTIQSVYASVISQTTKASQKAQSLVLFIGTVADLAELETPECLEDIHARYMKGLSYLTDSLNSFVDNDTINFAVKLAYALERIGEFRGYMAAMGADVLYDEDTDIYFK